MARLLATGFTGWDGIGLFHNFLGYLPPILPKLVISNNCKLSIYIYVGSSIVYSLRFKGYYWFSMIGQSVLDFPSNQIGTPASFLGYSTTGIGFMLDAKSVGGGIFTPSIRVNTVL